MIEEDFVVKKPLGLHIRVVSEFVNIVSKYKSDIKIFKDDQLADGKSPMDILTLIVLPGDKIKVIVDGEDEKELISVVREFFNKE
ncbi:MAG: HPr family phosphocarrier protein [Candidatus Anstonellales archaeon]